MDLENSQATQENALDPRRLGGQNSGFSDEDISDIICLLLPYSEAARRQLRNIAATENANRIVERENVGQLDLDYALEEDMRDIARIQPVLGEHYIALRFSTPVKDPLQGFTFGRNPTLCDVCFRNDPRRRLSNVHFRIYLNEFGVLMLEDLSTNGTSVDEVLLKKKDSPARETKRTLQSGSKIQIFMHQDSMDLVFIVRIPIRHGACQEAYERNLQAYMAQRERLANETIVPGPGGRVDIFKPAAQKNGERNVNKVVARREQADGMPVKQPSRLRTEAIPRPWNGSNKYNRVCEIGRGAFATVYKVTLKLTGHPYAAKELDKRRFMKNGVLDQKVENEMKIMQKVKHPHIVNYIEHLDWDDRLLIIIMDFVGGGDLGKLIAEHGPLSEPATKIMARQLLDALGYLHSMNITHRDVKPDNILVQSFDPFVVKLTDFGLSKMVDNDQTFLRTFCGTLLYCAPEVYSEYAEYDNHGRRHPRNRRLRPATGPRYHNAVDVWSLGGVLFYALTKTPPFPARNGASHSELLHQIMTKPLNVEPLKQANISNEGIDFLKRMLNRRPENRATIPELLNHPWLEGVALPPIDQVADEELPANASQLSLEDNANETEGADDVELQVPSDDEINDEDDEEVVRQTDHEDEGESEKENQTLGPANGRQRRLFGEVNPSAVGSSGGIRAERLNLPVTAPSSESSRETEVLERPAEIKDSFESDSDSTPRQPTSRLPPGAGGSRRGSLRSINSNESRSVEELNNMTFDVASQSLGGAESILGNLNMKSRAASAAPSHSIGDVTSSKRKPPSDLGEEGEAQATESRRTLKRLRSQPAAPPAILDLPVAPGEYELLVQVPCIRNHSCRQIDNPVHKSTFWSARDRSTWHLNYPEMTQLQFDAFNMAAAARNEEFGPGKTPLWSLAVKYFPPTNRERVGDKSRVPRRPLDDLRLPPTAGRNGISDDVPDTQRCQDIRPPMPIFSEPGRPVIACLQSAAVSAIQGISVLITEAMISWGRAMSNTRSYIPRTEGKVPKNALKILLWKPGFDPVKNFRPWNRQGEDEESLYFYIATKATQGISINGVPLPSWNPKATDDACRYWMRLHDGDRITVWQTADGLTRTELIFWCGWGGSSKPRGSASVNRPCLVADDIAQQLDEVCYRAERKMRGLSEHDLKMEEANHDLEVRLAHIDAERQRSRDFEVRRQEACRALGVNPHRRHSPPVGVGLTICSAAAAAANGEGSSSVAGGYSSYNRTVPALRHTSPPTASDLLRAARGG